MKGHFLILNYIINIFILFFLIYTPRINIGFPLLFYLASFSIIYIFINMRLLFSFFNTRRLVVIYTFFIFFAIYLIIIALLNDNNISGSGSYLNWIFNVFPIAIMLCIRLLKQNADCFDFFNMLLIVGLIQALLALSAFFLPYIHNLFTTFQASNEASLAAQERFILSANWRQFGLASNLSFSSPLVQAILSVISIFLSIEINYRYLFFSPFLLFSALINSRTSFIVFFIGLFIIICFAIKKSAISMLKNLIICLFFMVFFGLTLSWMIHNGYFLNYKWVMTGLNEILSFFFHLEPTGYFSYLTNSQKWLIPEGLETIFGVGLRIMFSNKYNISSDIGYVNDFWLGGAFYVTSSYLFFLWLLSHFALKSGKYFFYSKFCGFIFYLFLAYFFVLNFKGRIFAFNNVTNLFFVIYIIFILQRNSLFYWKTRRN